MCCVFLPPAQRYEPCQHFLSDCTNSWHHLRERERERVERRSAPSELITCCVTCVRSVNSLLAQSRGELELPNRQAAKWLGTARLTFRSCSLAARATSTPHLRCFSNQSDREWQPQSQTRCYLTTDTFSLSIKGNLNYKTTSWSTWNLNITHLWVVIYKNWANSHYFYNPASVNHCIQRSSIYKRHLMQHLVWFKRSVYMGLLLSRDTVSHNHSWPIHPTKQGYVCIFKEQ